MTITIIGLGPGDAGLITRQAWHLLSAAEAVTLRTRRHPAVAGLPPHLTLHSFDDIYDTAEDFAAVYSRIAAEVLRLGRAGDVIYAVPGHPFVGEATVAAVVAGAAEAAVPVQIVAGLSFVEPTLAALGVDALDGLQLFDAIELAGYLYPPLNPDVPVLLGQVYSRLLAGELKATLMSVYPPEQRVALVHAAGEAAGVVEWLALHEFDRSQRIDHLTSLYIPALAVKGGLTALAETVAVLRSPNGCPWDQEQTAQSLREGFLEEAYEALAALDAEDDANLREELGDLLYHIVMQTQIAAEADSFTLTEVIAGIEAKLKRRHPHVWGDWQVSSSAEVLRNWEILKQREKGARGDAPSSALDGVPPALPALATTDDRPGQFRDYDVGDTVRCVLPSFDWAGLRGMYRVLGREFFPVHGVCDLVLEEAG